MQTLEYLINLELEELVLKFNLNKKFERVSDFITDDTQSAEFIRTILDDETFIHPDETSPIYEISKARSRHSTLTFLIGLVFKKFQGLYDAFGSTTRFGGENINLKLWMMTALSHDKGYYSERLKKSIPAHKQFFSHRLLVNEYRDDFEILSRYLDNVKNVLAYDYDEIKTYDIASVNWRQNDDGDEKVDHGILGGHIVFNNYLNKLLKTRYTVVEKELYSIKTCALTIVQHNMFKSATLEEDKKYPNKPERLRYGGDGKITSETPLLLFLSLIDTFECVKKFSKKDNDRSINTLTILQKIRICVDEDFISIDYSDLFNYIEGRKQKDLIVQKNSYITSIIGLETWTVLKSKFDQRTNICKITLA